MSDEKIYSVRDVAQMLSTSEETVRRWIRSGKLVAHHPSRKEGNQITEASLKDFFSKNQKYKRLVSASVGTSLLPFVVPVLGAIQAAQYSVDEVMIDQAKKSYEASEEMNTQDKTVHDSDSDVDTQETIQNLVSNAEEGLICIQNRLQEAIEKRKNLDKEIEGLKLQVQLAQSTLDIARQTLIDITEFNEKIKVGNNEK